MESPSQALYDLLCEQQPKRVLGCSRSNIPALEAYRKDNECQLDSTRTDLQRYDLAIVADYLEHLDKASGTEFLAQLRNLHSHRIWVLIDSGAGWQLTDFIALGFQRLQHFADAAQPQRRYASYGYDIATYNHVRSWNNPRFWANPENFGKYWW